MGRLRKVCGQGTNELSPDDNVDSSEKPFIPDDYVLKMIVSKCRRFKFSFSTDHSACFDFPAP
uniref:Uncharacterized protein n=1 Tax=Triticum urartu TaxID=4572 RepID=A0A8R7TSN8_TRIUA